MKTLFQKVNVDEILKRVDKLSASSQRQWGKMNVDQMLAHCSIGLETAIGIKFFPQSFFGKLFGKFFKSHAVENKPIKKNSPTNPAFRISNPQDFEKEKVNLINLLSKFHEGGEAKCTTNPHSFLGKLTPEEWSSLQYNHLNHHLKQFGV